MSKRLLAFMVVAASCLVAACAGQPASEVAPSADDGSASRGVAYARRICAECHAVEAGQSRSPDPYAPAFEVIANTPGMSAIALNAWLHSPHPSMPNLEVDSRSRNDIAAYFRSLQRGDGRG
jgi:mono/diheme cytochrome c family protein